MRAPRGGGLNQQPKSRSPGYIPRQDWAQKLLTEEGSRDIRGTAEARTGRCPVCRDKHVYPRKFPWGSLSCPAQRLAGSGSGASGTSRAHQRMRAPRGGGLNQQPKSRSPGYIPRQDWAQKLLTEEGSRDIRGTAEARTGRCSVCRDKHVYPRKFPWGSLSWPSSRLQYCCVFRDLNPTQRAIVIEEQGGCVTCLSWAHTQQGCTLKEPKSPGSGAARLRCQESEGTEVCGRAHHEMLHGSNSAYAAADFGWGTPRGPGEFRPALFAGRPVGSLLTAGTAGAIFEIVEAPVLSVKGRRVLGIVFMDSGSNLFHHPRSRLTTAAGRRLCQDPPKSGGQRLHRKRSPGLSSRVGGQYRQGPLDGGGKGRQHHRIGATGRRSGSETSLPWNPGGGGETADRSSRLADLQGGINKGKLCLSKTPLGCGQVLTGVAETGKRATRGERPRAEGRAPQGETAARSVQGRSFHVASSHLVVTKEPHRQEPVTVRKTQRGSPP